MIKAIGGILSALVGGGFIAWKMANPLLGLGIAVLALLAFPYLRSQGTFHQRPKN